MATQIDADAIKAADALLAVAGLAARNFPADADIEVKTSGSVPASGRLLVPAYIFRRLIEAGRAALSTAESGK